MNGTPANGNGRRLRVWALLSLRMMVAAVILYALVQTVSVAEIVHAFSLARLEYIALALLLVVPNLGFQMLKWRYFVRLANPASSNLETIASLLFGVTIGVLTPGQLGEFGGRALRHHSVSSARIIGLALIDKFQMLLIMGMAAVVSYATLASLPSWQQTGVIIVAWGLFLYLFARPSLFGRLLSKVPLKILQHPWVDDLKTSLSLIEAKALAFSFVTSLAFYAVIYLQMLLLLNAFSPVPWWDAFLGFAAMMFFKAMLPISFGDLGIREAGSVYFYSLLAIPESTALNASLLLFGVNIIIPALLGLLFIPQFPRPRPDEALSKNTDQELQA